MKIIKVIIRNFRRFREAEFITFSDSVVIAGPNNAVKVIDDRGNELMVVKKQEEME